MLIESWATLVVSGLSLSLYFALILPLLSYSTTSRFSSSLNSLVFNEVFYEVNKFIKYSKSFLCWVNFRRYNISALIRNPWNGDYLTSFSHFYLNFFNLWLFLCYKFCTFLSLCDGLFFYHKFWLNILFFFQFTNRYKWLLRFNVHFVHCFAIWVNWGVIVSTIYWTESLLSYHFLVQEWSHNCKILRFTYVLTINTHFYKISFSCLGFIENLSFNSGIQGIY